MRKAPSVKALCETFGIDADTAKRIRWAWKTASKSDLVPIIEQKHKLHHGFIESRDYAAMLAIDVLGDFHGVECAGIRYGTDSEYVDYLNSGDTYSPTLAFYGGRMFITTLGDMIESRYVKEGKESKW